VILVTTGSSGAPFDRLLDVVERFDVDEEVVVQHGPSAIRPRGATCVEFLPFGRLSELIGRARLVVAHAGVGSILVCIARGRVPIVVPRLAHLGEVVDDHQLVLARRLGAAGSVVCVEDPAALPPLVGLHHAAADASAVPARGEAIVGDMKAYLDAVLV